MKIQPEEILFATEDAGSLPIQDDFEEDRRNVDRAIADKIYLGLDYPCYPQLPGSPSKPMDMGLQFLIPLSKVDPAIQIVGQEVRLVSEKMKETSTAIGVERAEYFARYIRESGVAERMKGIKACVTGPFTLASYLDRKNLMTCGASKPDVVKGLALHLSRSCKRLSDLGFDLVNIDEPFLSVMLGQKVLFKYDEKFVVDTLNLLIEEVSGLSAIHVCGTITPLVKTVLLQSKTDIIDHEFAGSPENLNAYTWSELEEAEKLLAYGCVSSVDPRIETVEEIARSVRNAVRIFGPRIMMKPDCGFGGLLGIPDAYGLALKKLENMVKAAQEIRESVVVQEPPER